ncbi:MAG: SIS domain-containing protein [Actinomycetota bacterium]|nr:SIS domain-containing protein [Actinomycetota bacterium]
MSERVDRAEAIPAEDLVLAAYERREELVRAFFEAHSERLAELCHAMARRFIRRGRLLAFGVGAAATDAQHVSVEFVHPVIVGKRALPAIALPNDLATSSGLSADDSSGFLATQLDVLGGSEDIALGMVHSLTDPGVPAVSRALRRARSKGMLTVFLGAGDACDADYAFEVADPDPFLVQEVHETLYHVLWELVHVFFEHKGLLEDRPPGSAQGTGRSSFLYPFLAEAEADLEMVSREVSESIRKKAADVIAMRALSRGPVALSETAGLIAERIQGGGKVLAFGNGGSATDAQDFTADLFAPPLGMRPVPALSLTNDAAVMTAVSNDVGFENVFARQVIAYGRAGDVAVAISTSGGSRNVLVALQEARRRDLLTVGIAGYGGGRMAELCERTHVVEADYIPRIQEAQASQYHCLRLLLGRMLA